MIEFVGPRFRSGPVHVATGFYETWKGLRKSRCSHGLLLPVRRVHGSGLRSVIQIIALDERDRVVATDLLYPGFLRSHNHFATRSGVSILELWDPGPVPAVNTLLSRVSIS